MSELAIVSAKKTKLQSEADHGNVLAQFALKLINNPERSLSTIQVGITLISILTGKVSADTLSDEFSVALSWVGIPGVWAADVAQALIIIVVTYLTIVFGELVPKRLGMCIPDTMVKMAAIPMHTLSIVTAPFVWILSKSTICLSSLLRIHHEKSCITEEEIRLLLRQSANGGDIQEAERHIVERVFTVGDLNLEDIMTPRADLVLLDINMSRHEVMAVIGNHPFSKYPVVENSLDNIKGFVHISELIKHLDASDHHFSLSHYLRAPTFFPETMMVYDALDELKRQQIQSAFVCDEFGNIKGIVSLRDILEALVGAIQEPRENAEIIVRPDGTRLIDGQCPFYHFLLHFHLDTHHAKVDYSTLGGLILEQLGHIPHTGERLEWNGFSLEVVDMDGIRIDKVLVTRLPANSTSPAIASEA